MQMAQFMKESVVEQIPPYSDGRPLFTAFRAKRTRRASFSPRGKRRTAHGRRKRADGDLSSCPIHIPGSAPSSTLVIEMDCSQALPKFLRQSAKQYEDVLRRQIVNAITTGLAIRKLDTTEFRLQAGHKQLSARSFGFGGSEYWDTRTGASVHWTCST